MKGKKPFDKFLFIITYSAATFTFLVLLLIIGYILVNGIPHLKPSLFSLNYTSENVSVFPAIISTIIITLMSLLIAVPMRNIISHIFNRICKTWK
jgi:phosphate transport system permease protein